MTKFHVIDKHLDIIKTVEAANIDVACDALFDIHLEVDSPSDHWLIVYGDEVLILVEDGWEDSILVEDFE